MVGNRECWAFEYGLLSSPGPLAPNLPTPLPTHSTHSGAEPGWVRGPVMTAGLYLGYPGAGILSLSGAPHCLDNLPIMLANYSVGTKLEGGFSRSLALSLAQSFVHLM